MIDFLASPAPGWLVAAVLAVGLVGLLAVLGTKATTVTPLALMRGKVPPERATIFNQAAMLQIAALAVASQTVFRSTGLGERPTWALLWWLEAWLLLLVSCALFVREVWRERVRPMWRDRWGKGRGN